jgi:deazaflavin-dependent oxidoreductase (nitroreductase family)
MSVGDERDPAERGYLRLFYRDWHPTPLGRIVNQVNGWVSARFGPSVQQVIEVRGRTSGKIRSTPVVVTPVNGERYLVSMLGPDSEWVKNVIAADGTAVLRHGRRERVHLVEVAPAARAPVLSEYVRIARSGRQHLPLKPGAPLSDFAAIAERYPVFRIERV